MNVPYKVIINYFFIWIESYDIIYTSASLWSCSFAIRSFKDEMVLIKAFLSSSQDSGSCFRGGISLSPYGNSVRDSTCMPSWWTALSKPYNKYKKKSVLPVLITTTTTTTLLHTYWNIGTSKLISIRKLFMLPHIKDRSVTQFYISAIQETLLNRWIFPQFQMKIPKVHPSNQYSNLIADGNWHFKNKVLGSFQVSFAVHFLKLLLR